MIITSTSNRHLTEIRRLASRAGRSRSGRFVAEGEDLLMAADAAGVPALYLLCAQGCEDGLPAAAMAVEPSLLASVSALGSSSRALGVFEQRWSERPVGPLCVALWGVRDPGNVGTVIRSARAFGAASIALGPHCADPHGPKAVRASMGSLFGAAIARVGSVAELPGRVVALDAAAATPLRGPLPGAVTLLIGGEREGLPQALLEQCAEVRSIPQVDGDSLNAAMAATVALYEATRRAP